MMAIFRELADTDPGSEKKCGIAVYGLRNSGAFGGVRNLGSGALG